MGNNGYPKDAKRQTGDETLPLLPLPLAILAKYKENPICLRRRVLLPVPSNEEYNRCLKEIGKETNFRIVLKTHKSRYFFANEVTYNTGVHLKTVSKMLGHKSVKTTEVYVRANKTAISESMKQVEEKLFDKEGNLKSQSVLPKPKNPLDESQGELMPMPSNR